MPPKKVFISYSHDSEEHSAHVAGLAASLRRDGVDCVIDQHLPAGPPEPWLLWMEKKIEWADFVVMVCTENYLRRVRKETPAGEGRGVCWEAHLIYQHIYEAHGINDKFIPAAFRSEDVKFIPKPLQGFNRYILNGQPGYLALFARLTGQHAPVEPLGPERTLDCPPAKPLFESVGSTVTLVAPSRLPNTGELLVGREAELKLLDDAWEDPAVHILSLVAWAGVGKTALVKHWMGLMSAKGWRGARRVFDWSFYSQGTSDKAATADLFVDTALRRFGDPKPAEDKPWEKGERLARLVAREPTLLVLDGLEPLQYPPGKMRGRLKDRALAALLQGLAASNSGLCVITTREAISDIKHLKETTAPVIELSHMTPEAGAQLLSRLGVEGTEAELQEASEGFEGHPLAVTLLGTWLSDLRCGEVAHWREVPLLEEDEEQGSHARRVMRSYEKWLEGGQEWPMLRLTGFFDRPAEAGALEALLRAPPIEGLTESLVGLRPDERERVLARLRKLRLLAKSSEGSMDAHPLVREYMGHQLRRKRDAWQRGHRRLFERLLERSPSANPPSSLAEAMPLYDAVEHACLAGLFDEAYQLFRDRIDHGFSFHSARTLGAWGQSLLALSHFFQSGWTEFHAGVSSDHRNKILQEVGWMLRSIGKWEEAIGVLHTAIDLHKKLLQWENASHSARNLSQIYWAMGSLEQASSSAEDALAFGNKCDDPGLAGKNRTRLAGIQHEQGKIDQAEASFKQAVQEYERAGHRVEGWNAFEASYQNFLYCDFLLDRAQNDSDFDEIRLRGEEAVRRASTPEGLSLHAIAISHLVLAKLYLAQADRQGLRRGAAEDANPHARFDNAVEGLVTAGEVHQIPRGYLARAAFWRLHGEFEKAKRDLHEVKTLVETFDMRLHLCDYHLEYARLLLAISRNGDDRGELDRAVAHCGEAKKTLSQIGYFRRMPDWKRLDRELRRAASNRGN